MLCDAHCTLLALFRNGKMFKQRNFCLTTASCFVMVEQKAQKEIYSRVVKKT